VDIGLSGKQFSILYPEENKKKTEQSGAAGSDPA
jgi:hypothetical protein